MLRLYFSHTSPFAGKVAVLLHETGQADQGQIVKAHGSPLDPSGLLRIP